MENNEQVVQPTSVETPAAEPSLADYRASRDPKAVQTNEKPATAEKVAAAASADPLEPGDPVVEDAGENENETPERKKKLGGFQKTIARQAAELDELKRKLADKPADKAGDAPAAAAAKPSAPAAGAGDDLPAYPVAKPKLEDCESLEEFTEKVADWKADERDWRRAALAGRAAAQAEVKARADTWKGNVDEFKVEHDDWDAVMAGVSEIKLSGAHQELFLESPHGVALAYKLAQDPAELERLSKLPPLQAAREIGKLEAAFAADAPAAEKEIKVSGAPPPFRPVSGSTNRGTPNPATMTIADYRKARESGRIQ